MPANPQVTDEMVEKAAEALASCVHPGRATSPNYWSDWVSSMDKDGFRKEARAALLAALADHVVVPREPTRAMIEAGCENNPTQWNDNTDDGFAADVANDVYRAMISASPLPQKEG
jgi:hypothetical protein